MELKFKALKTYMPWYWWFILPPVTFLFSYVSTPLIFLGYQGMPPDVYIFSILIFFWVSYFVLSIVLIKWVLNTRSYLLISQDNKVVYHGFKGKIWEIDISKIEAMDDEQGRVRAGINLGRVKPVFRSSFVIQSNSQNYHSYIKIAGWEEFKKGLVSIKPSIEFKDLSAQYLSGLGNKEVVSDQKLYLAGKNILKYVYWSVGFALILFCVLVIFMLRK